MDVSRFFADRFSWRKAISLLGLATLAALPLAAPPPAAAQSPTYANGTWSHIWLPCEQDGTLKLPWDDTLYYYHYSYATGGEVIDNCLDATATAADHPDVDASGTLTGYFTYYQYFTDTDDGQTYGLSDTTDYNGNSIPQPPPTPSTQAFAVITTFWAQTTANGDGATAEVTDTGMYPGDIFTTSDAPNGTESDVTHFVQEPVNGGMVEIDVNGDASAHASIPDGSTDAGAIAWGQVGAYAWDVEVGVTISSEIETSYYKTEDGDSNYPIQAAHQRNADGSISVDSAVQWQHDDNSSTVWAIHDLPLYATSNLPDATYTWSIAGEGSLFTQYSVSGTTLFSLNETSSNGFPKHSTVTVTAAAPGGVSASNTYDITWHLPKDNWHETSTGPYAQQLDFYPPSQLSGDGEPIDATSSFYGSWQWHSWDTGALKATGALIEIGGEFIVAEEYAPLLALIPLTTDQIADHINEHQDSQVSFETVWDQGVNNPSGTGCTFIPAVPPGHENDQLIRGTYRMNAPSKAVGYTLHEFQGDCYELNGYTGSVNPLIKEPTGYVGWTATFYADTP